MSFRKYLQKIGLAPQDLKVETFERWRNSESTSQHVEIEGADQL